MKTSSIKSSIHELLSKLSRVKSISSEQLFVNNKKIDSLDLMNLYSFLEKKFKIKFKSSELAKLTSINNIFEVINKKINEKKKRK